MELIFNHLYKVDRNLESAEKTEFQEGQPIKDYVLNVLDKVTSSAGDREYQFMPNSITMSSWLIKLILLQDIEDTCLRIANRLLTSELSSQEKIEHLGKEIQKGMLIISYVDMNLANRTEKKIIISKADYDEFIEESTGNLRTGLATKKKIYKAFVANVSLVDGVERITKITTFDTNSTMATYWWKDFFELDVIRKNDINTKNAFAAINKEILSPLEKEYKQDYLYLWNLTLGYFRATGEFSLDYYRDHIIGTYQPYCEGINISDLQLKCNELASRGNFDRRFTKDLKAIQGKKLKKTLTLTNEIDLIIKDSVPNIKEVFKGFMNDAGEKYIMIKSNEGYEYALNGTQNRNE
jgi:hypothetical protein